MEFTRCGGRSAFLYLSLSRKALRFTRTRKRTSRENLIPKDMKGGFSPFLATSTLPKDPIEFHRHRDVRFFASQQLWRRIKELKIHSERRNGKLFDNVALELGYEEPISDWQDRLRAEMWAIETYGNFFRPFTSADEAIVRQRMNLSNSIAG